MFLSSERQNTPAVQQHLRQLQLILTTDAILNYLIAANFIGYLNYELLNVFQKVVQSDVLESRIQQYELQHDTFLKNTKFSTIINIFREHPELAPASPIGLPKFAMRLEAPWEGRSIYSWKELLDRQFNWPPHVHISSISRNCIILTYVVLPFFVPAVVRDLTDQEVLLGLESQGVSVELSPDLLLMRDVVEVEAHLEQNEEENKNPTVSMKKDLIHRDIMVLFKEILNKLCK